ncbi:HAMP domain-containing sensor histidine kinase [uncultured Sphingomonas sp.]|uniref:sensor histidine kinase n=1 Tax=uncultured Sphingomonas sp. TaxID=158754 RepID=UPI0025F31A66|nr:HAMP domain-containing sensor histidine kinase [uncultured Sphingomonas sp.]
MIRALWRPPSALTAIGGFSVAIAVLSVVITASIVLLMPDPPAIRMTVADVAAALRGGEAGSLVLDRRVGRPPEGPPAPLLQKALARELHRPLSAVRVVWLDRIPGKRLDGGMVIYTSRGAFSPGKPLPVPAAPAGAVLVRRQGVMPMRMVLPGQQTEAIMSALVLKLPQPAFAAAILGADGRWLSVAPHQPLLGGWRLKVLAALAASLGVLAPLVWLFARRLTRPFRALATAIDEGRDPPQAQGPRELQEAAGAILQLRNRLAAESEERMRMLTAVAHDLRTPLTSLKLRIEAAPEPQRTRMIADADRMQAMIADVLDFARTIGAGRQSIAVRPLIADILADHPQVVLRDGPDVTVDSVEPDLRRAVENLVRNAIDYAGGGVIDVAKEAQAAVIRVIDAGPGIAREDRERLLRPFERGEASRSRDTGGVGLGLSIVSGFAKREGGELTLDDAPSGGLVVTLRLPL